MPSLAYGRWVDAGGSIMASTLDNALELLGLETADDRALLWQNFMDRAAVLQTKLIRASTESCQQDLQTQLAKLVAAYQLLSSVRRGPSAPGDAVGAVVGPRPLISGSAANALPPTVGE